MDEGTRKLAAASCLFASLWIVGCAGINRSDPDRGVSPLRRLGKDAFVVAATPVTLLTKPFQETGYTIEDGEIGYVFAAPLTWTFGVLRNTYWTGLHALDLVAYPFYAFSAATPLPVYDLETFPFQYQTEPEINGQHVYPPSGLIIPFYVITAGGAYFFDPYAWKFIEKWPSVQIGHTQE